MLFADSKLSIIKLCESCTFHNVFTEELLALFCLLTLYFKSNTALVIVFYYA